MKPPFRMSALATVTLVTIAALSACTHPAPNAESNLQNNLLPIVRECGYLSYPAVPFDVVQQGEYTHFISNAFHHSYDDWGIEADMEDISEGRPYSIISGFLGTKLTTSLISNPDQELSNPTFLSIGNSTQQAQDLYVPQYGYTLEKMASPIPKNKVTHHFDLETAMILKYLQMHDCVEENTLKADIYLNHRNVNFREYVDSAQQCFAEQMQKNDFVRTAHYSLTPSEPGPFGSMNRWNTGVDFTFQSKSDPNFEYNATFVGYGTQITLTQRKDEKSDLYASAKITLTAENQMRVESFAVDLIETRNFQGKDKDKKKKKKAPVSLYTVDELDTLRTTALQTYMGYRNCLRDALHYKWTGIYLIND